MIYNRFGDIVEIAYNCGKVHPVEFDAPVTLVRIQYADNKQWRWMFAEYLKADGGIAEIEDALSAMPVTALDAEDLKKALKLAR